MTLKHESLHKDNTRAGLDATFHNIFESGIKSLPFTIDNKCFANLDKYFETQKDVARPDATFHNFFKK